MWTTIRVIHPLQIQQGQPLTKLENHLGIIILLLYCTKYHFIMLKFKSTRCIAWALSCHKRTCECILTVNSHMEPICITCQRITCTDEIEWVNHRDATALSFVIIKSGQLELHKKYLHYLISLVALPCEMVTMCIYVPCILIVFACFVT